MIQVSINQFLMVPSRKVGGGELETESDDLPLSLHRSIDLVELHRFPFFPSWSGGQISRKTEEKILLIIIYKMVKDVYRLRDILKSK